MSRPAETSIRIVKKQAGDTLKQDSPEHRYRVLLSCLGDMVVLVGRDGLIREAHCPGDYEFMFSAEGVVGKRLVDLLPTQLGLQAMHYVEKTLRLGHALVFHGQYELGGRAREFQARLAPYDVSGVLALVRDVTDRRHFEREILEVSQRTQVRIGQDLHDGLGQHLSGITFLSRALENKLHALGLPEAAEAAEIARLVIQALGQTRHLSRSLFPVELDSGGLVPALKELAVSLRSLYKLSCVVESDGPMAVEDSVVANHLFRLAQEAVNNAVKHGKAQHVVIHLSQKPDAMVMTISDNGTGFDAGREKDDGLGLRIMRYRAQKIGAQLEFRASAEGGTQVICTLVRGEWGEDKVPAAAANS